MKILKSDDIAKAVVFMLRKRRLYYGSNITYKWRISINIIKYLNIDYNVGNLTYYNEVFKSDIEDRVKNCCRAFGVEESKIQSDSKFIDDLVILDTVE